MYNVRTVLYIYCCLSGAEVHGHQAACEAVLERTQEVEAGGGARDDAGRRAGACARTYAHEYEYTIIRYSNVLACQRLTLSLAFNVVCTHV